MIDQSIGESPGDHARTRMSNHPGRLVDHNNLVVLENDLEWNRLRCSLERWGCRQFNLYLFTWADAVSWFNGAVINGDIAVIDGAADLRTAGVSDLRGEIRVEPFARVFRGDSDSQFFRGHRKYDMRNLLM